MVQEDDAFTEHVIYYLSQGLVGPELRYSPIEKLALTIVHVVQRLRHYILIRKTFVLVVVNPFQFVLSRRVIGENTIDGLSFYNSLISNSCQPSLRNL